MTEYVDDCSLCGEQWNPDENEIGYVWLCPACREKPSACDCGSDDIDFDWTISDNQGEILEGGAYWVIECDVCGKQTALYKTAKEALDAWENGERLTPVDGTDHFEEAW